MSSIQYRPAIDGLRSIAVAAVLVFHLSPPLLPGGFLGVDLFFVISGFLITSIVLEESVRGEFSFLRFYQRRIARIFPLMLLVILATCVAAYFIYPGEDSAATGAAGVAAVASLANLKFMVQGDYFKLQPDTQPLLHTWSLSVEEQFYLFLPPAIILLHMGHGSKRRIAKGLAWCLIGSLAFSIWLTGRNPSWAFYLMPSRAWELLTGSLAAIGMVRFGAFNRVPWSAFLIIGLAGIAWSIAIVDETYAFPGWVAIVPVLSTAMVLVSERFVDDGVLVYLLRHRWLVGIGKISYSLYLWHWPGIRVRGLSLVY